MKRTNKSIQIRELLYPDVTNGSKVLGRGMRDNPLHLKAFGNNPSFREHALTGVFFAFLRMEVKKGKVLGAFLNDRLVGVCGMLPPGYCQLTPSEKIKLLPTLLINCGFKGTVQMLKWFAEWTKKDYTKPHWHLGPVGVERELQGQGIGSLLLNSFCNYMDKEKSISYLETDKPENVKFYQKFGFEVLARAYVIGVPNWFMIRKPKI